MTGANTPLIRLQGGRKAWYAGNKRIDILRGIDLSVFLGSSIAIMGPSGAGKSTLLHVLGLLTPLDSGLLHFNGRTISSSADGWDPALRSQIGFIFQDAKLIPELSVLENVCVPLVHRGIWPIKQKRLARAALGEVELHQRMDHKPNQLSGGEMMRVAIARAVVQHPRLLLADEPTGNLDSHTGARIVKLMLGAVTAERALVFVTHNQEVARLADRLISIKDGRIETET